MVFLGRVVKSMKNKKAQSVSMLIGGIVTIIVGVILMVGVAVPILGSTITQVTTDNTTVNGSVSLSGTTNLLIANNLTTFLLIGALLLIVGVAIMGFNLGKKE